VIYVMGSGRCGSTILGVTLGNCEGMFFVGELDRWLPSNGTPVLGGTERTRFWNSVRNRVDVDRDLLGERARDSLERGLGPLRIAKWPGRRRFRRRYRRTMGDLYRTIASIAGATHIVETSHFPLRARELKAIPGLDVYLIFLVRHPQSMLASFTRTVGRNDLAARWRRVLKTNADIWITHLLGTWVFLRHRSDRRLFMHYEDFTADPQAVLQQVLDMSDSAAAIPDLTTLHTGFPMGGNRLLRSDVVALTAETPKPPQSDLLTAVVQAPLTALTDRLRPLATTSAHVAHASRQPTAS
jgi:Sulfotransferase family